MTSRKLNNFIQIWFCSFVCGYPSVVLCYGQLTPETYRRWSTKSLFALCLFSTLKQGPGMWHGLQSVMALQMVNIKKKRISKCQQISQISLKMLLPHSYSLTAEAKFWQMPPTNSDVLLTSYQTPDCYSAFARGYCHPQKLDIFMQMIPDLLQPKSGGINFKNFKGQLR